MRWMTVSMKWILKLVEGFDAMEASYERWSMKSKSGYVLTVQAGNALVKFCEDHQRPYPALNVCVSALEAGDFRASVVAFKKIPFGGNGCFGDWFPPVVFENETPEYVQGVFEALTERFYRLAVDLLDVKRRA